MSFPSLKILKVCFWKCDLDDMASIMISPQMNWNMYLYIQGWLALFEQKKARSDENGIWTTTIFEKSITTDPNSDSSV